MPGKESSLVDLDFSMSLRVCEAVSGASECLMRSAGKPILGVRWCAWDGAEALEGAAGTTG